MASIKDTLKKMGTAWKIARANADRNSEYEDGQYEFKLTSAEPWTSDAGALKAKFIWTFTDGEYEGKEVAEFFSLDDPDRLVWFARRCAVFGYDVESIEIEKIPALLEEMAEAGFVVKAALKTSGDWQNFKLKEVLEGDGGGDTTDEIEVGDVVTWKDGKKTRSGEVKKIKDDTATITGTDDETYKVSIDELNKEEKDEEPEDADAGDENEIAKGDTVSFKNGKKTVQGVVKKINKDGTLNIETDDEIVEEMDPEDCTKVEDEPEEESKDGELSEGDPVIAEIKGKKEKGKILELDGDFARVEVKSSGKTFRIATAKLTAA